MDRPPLRPNAWTICCRRGGNGGPDTCRGTPGLRDDAHFEAARRSLAVLPVFDLLGQERAYRAAGLPVPSPSLSLSSGWWALGEGLFAPLPVD